MPSLGHAGHMGHVQPIENPGRGPGTLRSVVCVELHATWALLDAAAVFRSVSILTAHHHPHSRIEILLFIIDTVAAPVCFDLLTCFWCAYSPISSQISAQQAKMRLCQIAARLWGHSSAVLS
mmetsp:Transcript_41787/g.90169  ORF Transcript_41787/g.90169 Transcript_41787/m.90169 type:complete len:122 (+) Transcript_41787:150-515(+)